MALNPCEMAFSDIAAKHPIFNPGKPPEAMTIADFRRCKEAFAEFSGPHANVPFEDIQIPTEDGHYLTARMFNPEASGPAVILFPGCSYMNDLYEANCIAFSRLAACTDVKIILIQYRLNPEYPMPISIDDGFNSLVFLAQHHKDFNIDPMRLILGGWSSGAHCAAVASHRGRKAKDLKIQHCVLHNGIFDFTQSFHEFDVQESEDPLCRRKFFSYIFDTLSIGEEQLAQPIYSPVLNDLSGLPPTTIIVSEHDGLRNDSEYYYRQLKAAGNDVKKILIPGQTHNTIGLRQALPEGEDPAAIMAQAINQSLKRMD